MKTAPYIEDGLLQIVLTPETDQEKSILALFEKKEMVSTYRGSFYECQGGWVRQKEVPIDWPTYRHDRSDNSLILILKDKEAQ